jgi:two-component system chemotaxis response regulator CheY
MPGKLLVTDDALIVREMIKDAAVEAGWQIVGEAANGRDAVDRFRETCPDVTTIDVVMPQFDGLFALRGIRELDPEARVVMVSAIDQKEVLREAFRLGAADFIVKPFNRAALVETLNRQLAAPTQEATT